MKLVNLTPHAVNIITDGSTITVEPSGTVARCATTREVTEYAETGGVQFPITRTRFGEVSGVPDPAPDTLYIVSSLVAQALPERDDLVIPDDTVRDDQGRIIGCRALARVR